VLIRACPLFLPRRGERKRFGEEKQRSRFFSPCAAAHYNYNCNYNNHYLYFYFYYYIYGRACEKGICGVF